MMVLSLLCAAALCTTCALGGPPGDAQMPDGLVISEPRIATGSPTLGAAASAVEQPESWVSASPGTFDDAITVQIRNVTTGGPSTSPVVVMDGGFDPVAVAAGAGDELELTIHHAGGGVASLSQTVPIRRPPVVVRTQPLDGRIDVALSVWPVVVISEPIDPGSVTRTSVQLVLDGAGVGGTVELVPGTPFAARFLPQDMLEPSTTYELLVNREIRDLDGEALEREAYAAFTTRDGTVLPGSMVLSSVARDEDFNRAPPEIYAVSADGSAFVNLTNHPASDAGPAISPDGMRILFTSDRDGNEEVYVMNADGSGLVNLTNNPLPDGSAVWSPDGSMIAFVSYDDPDVRACTGGLSTVLWPCPDIFVMNADGSNRVNLTRYPEAQDNSPAWSPDGTKIAFTSKRERGVNTSDIFVMNADGTNVVRLTQEEGEYSWGFGPAWSPDGSRIAFNGGPAPYRIWVMNADGSNPVALTEQIYLPRWPTWSPDGTRIAFTMINPTNQIDDAVFIMNADGTGMVNVTSRDGFDDRVGSPQGWWR